MEAAFEVLQNDEDVKLDELIKKCPSLVAAKDGQGRAGNTWFAQFQLTNHNTRFCNARTCILIDQFKQCKPIISNPSARV